MPGIEITVDANRDAHSVQVLERHPGWQLVRYRYGNTSETIGLHPAYRDRIEPVSYSLVAEIGIAFAAMLLVLPALLAGIIIHLAWKRVARRRARVDAR